MRRRSRKGAPGILDVAARAGVSGATVSRCFSQPTMVRPETRARIEQAAAELGYIRDRLASGLQKRVSGTVGLIVPTIANAIVADLIEAFSQALQTHDRTMLIASHDYDSAREVELIRSLLERRTDAIALVGHDHSTIALEMLALRDLPTVALWCAEGPRDIPAIGTDNAAAAREVTNHLLELGHTDIALLFPNTEANDRARQRVEGTRAALAERHLVIPPHRKVFCPYDIDEAKRIASAILMNDPPTAFICGNDIIAQGVLHAARQCRIEIPAQLSVVGIGDFTGSSAIEPGLTTVRLPARRIGRMAAESLVARLDGVHAMPADSSIVLEAKLVVRNSTAPPCRG